ncbi:MAG: tyrosine-type recombinase/integrase [Ilumatobacter sp.]
MGRAASRRSPGDGALFYRADRDRWVGRVTIDGEHRTVSAKTKTEARKELDLLRRAADDGLPLTEGSMTVADLLTAWADKALPNRELADSAMTSHRWAIRILVEEIGNVKVRRLTPDQVEAAFLRRTKQTGTAKRSGRGRTTGAALSRSSLVKIRSTLSQALKWAQRRNLVARNIATLVEIPAGAAKPKSGKSLTVAEAKLLLAAAAGTDLEAMWVVMLYLGLRPGEAAGLAWRDLDFDAGTVHVWRSRKTASSGNSVVGSTKTPGSIRTLDAPQPVLDSFVRHRRRQQEQRLAAGSWWTNEENLVFTSPSGKPCDSTAVRKEFREVIAASRVEGHWTPNLLRHSAASLMADAGMPIELVADQLGHRDLRMLQRHYRHRIRPTIAGGAVVDGLLSLEVG